MFSVTPPAAPGGSWTGLEIHRFTAGSDDPLGTFPLAGVVIGPGGVLYGTTSMGAKYFSGAAFSLTPRASAGDAWTSAVLYDFPIATEQAAYSPGGLMYGRERGVLYGVTLGGGPYGRGTAFSLSPPGASGAWTHRLLHAFTGGDDGARPNTLVIGGGGLLYGTTQSGGAYGDGTVFSLKPQPQTGPAFRIARYLSYANKRRRCLPVISRNIPKFSMWAIDFATVGAEIPSFSAALATIWV